MENNTFSFLRIVKEHVSQFPRTKSMAKEKLQTNRYLIEFFYKPITKMIDTDSNLKH